MTMTFGVGMIMTTGMVKFIDVMMALCAQLILDFG
jgi:hypothetical protein